MKQLDKVMDEDKIDVLKNLFEHRRRIKNTLIIKSKSHLPYSCPANVSSPLFLHYLTDNQFSDYYKPLGFGWSSKKYRDWCDDLHVFMIENLDCVNNEDYFIKKVINHINSYRSVNQRDLNHYEDEIRYFYNKFKI